MSDNFAASTTRLKCLIKLIMEEDDPVKYDELGAAIWQVLEEREHLTEPVPAPIEAEKM